ncbi:hypothetical protein GWG54_05745 [Natronococcus sp. JC468]|uniref:hypothetical protein n=1 Tax=Natronococcus sp. JC468 TaxID=1961921 RepID=UPI0014387CE7|nr:hypothetical protein [Natronococcus sp. JC468]NKE35322.1 hypothetical protein [Natronococcus sp. JC468]
MISSLGQTEPSLAAKPITSSGFPGAPIRGIADYAIHGDLFDVVPALAEEFQ